MISYHKTTQLKTRNYHTVNIVINNLSRYVHRSVFNLIEGLLSIDQEERMDTRQILSDVWFKHYYQRYKHRIEQKSKSQKERHKRQFKKLQILPYYSLNSQYCVL